MRLLFLFFALFSLSCGALLPGKLSKLPPDAGVSQKSAGILLSSGSEKKLSAQYLGCGGLYLLKGEEGILIDPFFSNQKIRRLIRSTLGSKRKIRSDPAMVKIGLDAMAIQDPLYSKHVKAILVAHSHYDHLMDVPAVYKALGEKPDVYLNESGGNVCGGVIDHDKIKLLEDHYSTKNCVEPPIRIGEKIRVYPILAKHNPHTHNIKFFDGSLAQPLPYFNDPYDKTKANDWLEGNTFSFLIDYLDAQGKIELRLFVQSSSCGPPAGIPPDSLLKERPVDVAFLGVASYEASPFYPDRLIEKMEPQQIVWIHWEDFFRKYDKKAPKTVRSTNVARFFQKPIVQQYRGKFVMPWPRTILDIKY